MKPWARCFVKRKKFIFWNDKKDMQFTDVGTQDRSERFYEEEKKKKEAEEVLSETNKLLNGIIFSS